MKLHKNLSEILLDQELASLGDAYVNFVYSLALSNTRREPTGAKLKGDVLAEALRRTGLRDYLPSRMTRHKLADAAEAFIVYAWLHGYITLDESVAVLEKNRDNIEGLGQLLLMARNRIKIS